MVSIKAYTVRIGGNVGKVRYLEEVLGLIEQLSKYVFELGREAWSDQKELYHRCRVEFPSLNSKVLQNFLRFFYKPQKGKRLPKQPVRPTVVLDYQNYNLVYDETASFSNWWLRFHRKNFPLFGKSILERIDLDNIKTVQLYKRNGKLYAKLTITKEVEEPPDGDNAVGCDINTKRLVLSNNTFHSLKRLHHRKLEHPSNLLL